jgi:hypothetical protein
VERRRPKRRGRRPYPRSQVTRVGRIEPLLRLPLASDFIKPHEFVVVVSSSFVLFTQPN